MELKNIRNFSIIAHIDHGKSTLADRLLEVTHTIEKRKMRAQVLDMMDLERERGITIKMQPVRMKYVQNSEEYLLNLIDTPGHIDFSYEVSRALQAVEGVLLLVDATQGVQAQTFTVLNLARDLGLKIIPVINKIDSDAARVTETEQEIMDLLKCESAEIMKVSGKTGAGVAELLTEIVAKIPAPTLEFPGTNPRALIFDFSYSTHQGVIIYARLFDGEIKKGEQLMFRATGEKFTVLEVGSFMPEKKPLAKLSAGEIGYIVTGVKRAGTARVGDTVTSVAHSLPAVAGYSEPKPVVWASLYPENADDFVLLRQSLERLRLSDAALSFNEESSGTLGRGFRAGFLGLLHLEIIVERLKREFDLSLVVTTPSIGYEVKNTQTDETKMIYSPSLFPSDTHEYEIREPWLRASIILPPSYLGNVIRLFNDHEVNLITTENFSDDRSKLEIELPLRELMRHFFDELKSVSSGFASFSYQLIGLRPAEVVRLDVLVNGEIVAPFCKVVSRAKVEHEAQAVVEKLEELMPRQLITIKLQAQALGRIIAARSLSALRKDVTDYLYGGDITRKMKLREKQKKGKKKMQARGSVNIPPEVFLKMISSQN
ncbi:MAG: translation elongation factor 4 [Patescibacteria group bacterium]